MQKNGQGGIYFMKLKQATLSGQCGARPAAWHDVERVTRQNVHFSSSSHLMQPAVTVPRN